MKSDVLQINRPIGKTVFFALLIILGAFLLLEIVVRIPAVHTNLAPPTIASSNRKLELKFARLDQQIAAGEEIECIAVGSSIVNRGFDPPTFAQAYSEQIGEPIDCFNFGIGNLNAQRAEVLTELIVQEYEPSLLIYGVGPREMAVAENILGEREWLIDNKWVQYKLGEPSLEGWLIANSYAVRYLLHPGMLSENVARLIVPSLQSEVMTTEGFEPLDDIITERQKPNIANPSAVDQKIIEIYADYELKAANLEALDDIIELETAETHVVLIEMPVHVSHFSYFAKDRDGYETNYLDPLQAFVEENDGEFVTLAELQAIPDVGWKDNYHLNRDGARLFSEWLGRATAVAILADQ